jgi:2-polyprenyl-3-methyl-5-hydroxy-6-metoxy-1,4-benzoquinol methylase
MRWTIAQWFEKRWWKRYLKNRSVEDYLEWKKSYWKKFLSTMQLDIPIYARILDAGCGPAGIFIALQGKVTACDPLLLSYEKLPHFSIRQYPNVDFKAITIESLPFDSAYDMVFCLNVINHVQDMRASLDALIKAMDHNAQLIISIDCHNWRFFKWLFRLIPMDILHPHQFDLNDYAALLTARGLKMNRTMKLESGFFFDYYVLICEKP